MTRKERAGKIVYLYEPLYNKLTPTTYKEIAGWLGVEHSTVKSYAAKKLYHHKIAAYILNEKPTVAEKKKMIFDFKLDDEQWRKTNIPNIEISSYGRVRNTTKSNEKSVILTSKSDRKIIFRYNGKGINVKKMVYETFVGKIPKNHVLVSKNGIREDLSPGNLKPVLLMATSIKANKERMNKPVVYLDQQGNVIEEYKSIKHASEQTYVSVDIISRVCRGITKLPYSIGYANAFMWADEYYEKEGIC
ncbi:hypothetical protein [Mammaliicoccus sciuri]|uniref:hypothetical protein n=1 Tax=Mammaliicoccus sciuri TaxID=1296 RepID=UPI0019511C32|nr:hypothetical protein [Mammaliicoccus sciuri]